MKRFLAAFPSLAVKDRTNVSPSEEANRGNRATNGSRARGGKTRANIGGARLLEEIRMSSAQALGQGP